MSETNYGPYHRLGEPGGPGCEVSGLPIMAKLPSGEAMGAILLSPRMPATELELLRTIALSIGIRWGQDEFGWWAMVPDRLHPTTSGAR